MQSQRGIRRRDDNPYRLVGSEPQSLATANAVVFLLLLSSSHGSQTVLNLLHHLRQYNHYHSLTKCSKNKLNINALCRKYFLCIPLVSKLDRSKLFFTKICYYRLGYLCFKFILYKRWTRVYLMTNEMLSEDNPSDSAVSLAFPAFSACSTTRHFP